MSLSKGFAIFSVLLVGFSIPAFANVGFCPVAGDCFTATGLVQSGSQDTISINGSSFEMDAHSGSSSPWDLLLAIPNGSLLTAPTLTFAGNPFTLAGGFPVNDGHFTTGNLYTFAGLQKNPASMNDTNMFGSNEQAASGGTPTFFEVFDYRYTPAFTTAAPYDITVVGNALANGTFVAANGGGANSSTPFTVTGLVNGPVCTNCVPKPSQIVFLSFSVGLIGLMQWRKQRGQA